MATLLDVVVPLLVIVVMTVLGTDLRVDDFRRVREYPILVPAVVLGQWAFLTLGTGAIVKLLPLAPAVAGGALLVAAAPVAAIVAVLTLVVVDQSASIRAQITELLATSALFTLLMLTLGAVTSRLVARRPEDRRALVWGFPARNVGVATLVATAVVGQVAMASFVAVLFATQVAILVPVALWLRRRPGESATVV